MFECMVNFTLVEHSYGAMFRPQLSEPGYVRLLTRWRKPYRTRDGYVCVVPYSTQHWERFFEEAGCPALMADTRFATLGDRTRNIDALYAELARCLSERTTAQWLAVCERIDVPAAPMHRLSELEADPHLAATGFFQHLDDPGLGHFVLPRAPLRFDGATAASGVPPRLGQHTVDVLEEAGLPADTIAQLLEQRAAVQHTNKERKAP
jgi:crotonobetainyl-CoA:carnitine CoA-transferase CaiB-like acyl-CoA transferase